MFAFRLLGLLKKPLEDQIDGFSARIIDLLRNRLRRICNLGTGALLYLVEGVVHFRTNYNGRPFQCLESIQRM